MASKSKSRWQTISLTPLTGPLDARYRSTDSPDGGYKEKQNWAISENGRLTRKCGYERFLSSYRVVTHTAPTSGQLVCPTGQRVGNSDNTLWSCLEYINWDFHKRGVSVRKAVSRLLEVTDNDNTRTLFACTDSEISYLVEPSGVWVDVLTGLAGGSKFDGDFLNNTVIFTNNKDNVYSYDLGTAAAVTIPDLTGSLGLSRARVVTQFGGLMLLMNTVESSAAHPDRVRYSDLNLPKSWAPATDSVANFQDLGGGEKILAAIELAQYLYIFTQKSIWKSSIAVDAVANTALSFIRVYTEPKNFKGCIVYPDSLVSDGQNIYYGSRESFYVYNQYQPAPESPEWLRQATGLIYSDAMRKVDPNCCNAMVAEYKPLADEIWVSWPAAGRGCVNNHSMIVSTKFLTGNYMDAGFSALCNYIPNATGTADCNTLQLLVGCSNADFSLKQLGGVLFRESVAQIPSNENPTPTISQNITDPAWTQSGFTSILRGMVPIGLFDVAKVIRKLVIGQYTAKQDSPCIARLRIGTSHEYADPNNTTYCKIVWHAVTPDLVLECPEQKTAEELQADGMIPSENMHWDVYESGRYLYFEISILNADGTPAIGGDTHWFKLDFDVMPLTA